MAAVRLALMGLCRCNSAAASACGGGLEMRQDFRPAAMRNLEAWRRFSTEGIKGANQEKPLMEHETESFLRMWWQRSRDYVKNDMQGKQYILMCIVSATAFCYVFFTCRAIHQSAARCTHNNCSGKMPMAFFGVPALRPMIKL